MYKSSHTSIVFCIFLLCSSHKLFPSAFHNMQLVPSELLGWIVCHDTVLFVCLCRLLHSPRTTCMCQVVSFQASYWVWHPVRKENYYKNLSIHTNLAS